MENYEIVILIIPVVLGLKDSFTNVLAHFQRNEPQLNPLPSTHFDLSCHCDTREFRCICA